MNEQAVRTIRTLLPSNRNASFQEIENAVDQAMRIYTSCNRYELIREVQSLYSIGISNYKMIEREKQPWIRNKKSSISWDFWERYRQYLSDEKNYPEKVLYQLDSLTDRTLDGMFDPTIQGMIDKKGLVVGQVQSGKTSNYIGLICKAVDAGYKFIIVLAGIHNSLRSQTQLRVDEGFLGFDTQSQRAYSNNNKRIGVGIFNPQLVAHSLTSSLGKGDFKTNVASSIGINFDTQEPIIAVVKKNATILKRLSEWLELQTITVDGKIIIRNKSLLLIDDEADNASINTNFGTNNDITAINGLIRQILGLFEKKCYVGYTATPFANIFIPIQDDELFPKDFIINLPVPTNYIGPEKIFGFELTEDEQPDNLLPTIIRVNDYNDYFPAEHKKDDALPNDAPKSLKLAIRCFIITCTIRRLRGQKNVHNSMLVHVTRFIRWQEKIKEIVEKILNFYRRGIEMNVSSIIEEFRQTFEDDTSNYKSYTTISGLILESEFKDIETEIQIHKWDEVKENLFDAVSRIEVMELNGGSKDALNYYDHKNGLSVIAVGGNKLSRGLTLEGLSISYFLRTSRMYDTLMQMGRWFGYKKGYVDLCRLFSSKELNEWFCHITLASEELREEFNYMSDIVGSTPEKYALKVRTHQGVLQITASNKIRNTTEVKVSWSGTLLESYELSKSPDVIKNNLDRTINFVNCLGDNFKKGSDYYLWKDIPVNKILTWISEFEVHENLKSASGNNLFKFIISKNKNGTLMNWNVGIISKQKGKYFEVNPKIKINQIYRLQSEDSDPNRYLIRKSHIIGPENEFIDLSADEKIQAMESTKKMWAKKGKEGLPNYPNGNWVRNNIRNPDRVLLLLYFLDPEGAKLSSESGPIVGYAISFPGNNTNDAVSYIIGRQLLPFLNTEDDEEEREDEDEDE